MSICTWAKQIWHQSPSPPPSRCFPQIGCQMNKARPTNCGKHFVLCPSCWHDGVTSPQLHCCGANEGNRANNDTMYTIVGLPLPQWGCKNLIPKTNMVLNIHSNASYLLEPKAQSHACGHVFMGWTPKNGKPIHLNGAFHVISTILWFAVSPTGEAKLGALYHNCQTGIIHRLTLKKMGHTQPKTPVHCNNATAVSVGNNSGIYKDLKCVIVCCHCCCRHRPHRCR